MIEKYINSGNRKLVFTKTEIFYLLLLMVVGTITRFFYHYNRPFVGDEVATLIQIKKSAYYILTQFEPWLTMNYFILSEKYLLQLAYGNQLSLIILPEIAGIATIPLTAIFTKIFASKKTALISATLIAFNPYLISFSGIIRSYSLLTALSLLTIILFFNWCTNRTFRNGIYLALASYALMLSHLNGAYTLAYIFSLAGIELYYVLVKKDKNKILTFVIPMTISMVFTFVSYISIAEAISDWGIPWHNSPPTSISYIFTAFSGYFGVGFYGWVAAFFMFTAIFLTIRVQNNPLLILLPFIALSILLISIQGISHFPDAYTRFLIFLVPVCVIFIAEGIVYLSGIIPVKNSIAITIFTLLLVLTWVPNFMQGYRANINHPYERVAAFIKNSGDGNTILSNDWSGNLNLTPYFNDNRFKRYELRSYSEQKHVRSAKNIYFIITGLNIKSDYPVHAYGSIQVIVYPMKSYKDQLFLIQNDLQKRISDLLVSPGLADTYKNLWFINKARDNDPALNFKYYDLFMRCSELSPRQKNIPLSLKLFELKKAGYNVGK